VNVTGRDIVIAVVFLVVGWLLRTLWDAFVDWLYETHDIVTSFVWDACAVLGILVVCVGLGFAAMHGHWFGGGT